MNSTVLACILIMTLLLISIVTYIDITCRDTKQDVKPISETSKTSKTSKTTTKTENK
jgi:hypothetical protein